MTPSRRVPIDDPAATDQRGRLPTSIDVAVLAQVSQSTVSRALRGDPSITAATRERVVRVAAELGYFPDSRAVRLRDGSVGTIAVVLLFPAAQARGSFNPFYYEILSAVEAAATRRGISILLSGQSHSSSLRADFERRREADGIIVIGTASNKEAWDFFASAHQSGANVVAWGAPEDSLPAVRADNVRAGELAAAHLIASGRRKLAFVGPGWAGHHAFRSRREGFRAELARHGLADLSIDIDPATSDRTQQGAALVNAILESSVDIDGVFAASDVLAAGVIRGLLESGRAIPNDVAVVGFDGGQGARHFTPTLTTIEQNVVQAGELLVAAVLGARDTDETPLAGTVSVNLAIRESSH